MRTKQNLSDIISNKFTLYKIQCILSSFALGIAAWSLADGIRTHLLQDYNFKMYSWVEILFYALESNLLNYINTSFALALWAIVIYFVMNERMFHWLKNKIELNNLLFIITSSSHCIRLYNGYPSVYACMAALCIINDPFCGAFSPYMDSSFEKNHVIIHPGISYLVDSLVRAASDHQRSSCALTKLVCISPNTSLLILILKEL